MTVADGKVFVTSQTGVQAFDAAGTRNCSGTPKICMPLWASGGSTGASGTPVVANGVLYVPGYVTSLSDSMSMAAFDAAGSAGCSGTPVVCTPMWAYGGTSGGAVGSPTIADGVLYYTVGSTLNAFDARGSTGCSGTPKTCAPLWTAAMSTQASPVVAVANGIVYVRTTQSGTYVFDAAGTRNCTTGTTAKTCAPLWTAATPGLYGGALAVANGVLYALAGVTLYAYDASAAADCPGTGAVRTCSRSPLWTSAASVHSPDGASLTVANGVVYVTSYDGGIDAFDAAGSLNCSVVGTAKMCTPLWDHVTGISAGGSPVMVNGVLFVNSPATGDVYALSA
jgi:hypothetical protein